MTGAERKRASPFVAVVTLSSCLDHGSNVLVPTVLLCYAVFTMTFAVLVPYR